MKADYASVRVFPYQMELMGIKGCGMENFCDIQGWSWHPSVVNNNHVEGRYISAFQEAVRTILYDPFYDQPAILTGNYRIDLEFYKVFQYDEPEEAERLQYLDYVDLEGIVDSPIASIEWGTTHFL